MLSLAIPKKMSLIKIERLFPGDAKLIQRAGFSVWVSPSRLILLRVGCFHLCPSLNGYVLQLFNLICSLPCRPVKEEPEPSEADAPGRWPSTYVNRTPPTPSESVTTVKSLIKSFDLGRPGIVSFCLISKTQIQTIASWIQPVSAALAPCWYNQGALLRLSTCRHVQCSLGLHETAEGSWLFSPPKLPFSSCCTPFLFFLSVR